MIGVRVVEDDKLDAYVAVWNAITPAEPSDPNQQRERRARDPRRLYVVAELDGDIVGCGFAGPSQSEGRGFLSPSGDDANVPEGTFVALAGGEVVGFSGLCRNAGGGYEDGLSVVRRSWRRRGLAEALKREKLAWAAANGVEEIATWTQRGNEGMRALNERLGYAYRSVSITVRADLPVG
jgi:GNAT superfamily N-acetyltransferase